MNSPNSPEIAAYEKAIAEIIEACGRLYDTLEAIDNHPSRGRNRRPLTIHAENGAIYHLRATDASWEVES